MKWYLLVHQLPPRPLYFRAKVRNRLAKVGAVALKNSVYVLPAREDCLEDFQWIAQEAAAGGGEAYVCRAEFEEGVSSEGLVQLFKRQSGAAYGALGAEVAEALGRLKARSGTDPPEPDVASAALRFKKRLEEVRATDFFGAAARKEAEAMLRSLEARLRGKQRSQRGKGVRKYPDLTGRLWVTRPGIRVDRIASAWLVRRFVDPGARFRFVDPGREPKRPGEVRFDMPGGDFTHEGERCTFETLVARLRIGDPALAQVAEVVHDIDLKDGKFSRPDAAGVRQLLLGLERAHPSDEERLARGFALFDDLYASFRGEAAAPPRRRRSRPAVRTRRSKRGRR